MEKRKGEIEGRKWIRKYNKDNTKEEGGREGRMREGGREDCNIVR